MSTKEGPSYRFKQQRFWAENGLIRIEDQETGEFTSITRRDALLRARALNDSVPHLKFYDEQNELQTCVENLIECIKEAKRQGDPMDPEASKQVAKDRRPIAVSFDGCGRSDAKPLPDYSEIFVPGVGKGTLIPSASNKNVRI